MKFSFLLVFLLLTGSVAAQTPNPEDPGPYNTDEEVVWFWNWINTSPCLVDPPEALIHGIAYYPQIASTSTEQFPLVAFMHGLGASAPDYDNLCRNIASWGYVVVSMDVVPMLFPSSDREAANTRDMMHWMANYWPQASLIDPAAPWGAVGHSMGATACFFLANCEPNIEVIVPLQPFTDEDIDPNLLITMPPGAAPIYPLLSTIDCSVYQVEGDMDTVSPPVCSQFYHDALVGARRSFRYLIHGMGHFGPADECPSAMIVEPVPLPCADQIRLHNRIIIGALQAELRGEEDYFEYLLGSLLATEPVSLQSRSTDPLLWIDSISVSNNLFWGVTGQFSDPLAVLYSNQQQGPGAQILFPIDGVIHDSLNSNDPAIGMEGFREGAFAHTGTWTLGQTVAIQGAIYQYPDWLWTRVAHFQVQ